ncbi:MAG: hypothetical protein RMJ55_15860 [Roseiflexaceae bacterium]|nr:hypothetical protein [Roseiflexaceae bacterium]
MEFPTGCDVAGLTPSAGAIFDGANALISLVRGDTAGAARAAAAAPIPVWRR